MVMRTLLDRLEINEADYSNDLSYRKRAVSFVDSLKEFVSRHSDMLIPTNGGFYVLSDKFWKDPSVQDLYVFFSEKGSKGSNVKAGVGKFRSSNALVLPFLKAYDDLSNLEDRIGFNSSVIMHELIHLMDKGYGKGKSPDISNEKSYYNNASEWNAFWQEGAFNAERLADNPILSTKDRWAKVIGLTFSEFQAKSKSIWDKNFIDNMDASTKKKFNKRIYQLWMEISKKIPKE